jgi:hypothetical protein
MMDYHAYYAALFRPVVEEFGPLDRATLTAIVGFDAGGPVSLSTIGRGRVDYPTFITCELSVRDDQIATKSPPFELLMTCNDEDFARRTLTALGDLSLSAALGSGHIVTLDDELAATGIAGVLLEHFATAVVGAGERAILRVLGVDTSALSAAKQDGIEPVIEALRREGTYPRTHVHGPCVS